MENSMEPVAIPEVHIGDAFFTVALDGNPAAHAFYERIKKDGPTLKMYMCGEDGLMGDLPWSLPMEENEISVESGDILLSGKNRILISFTESAGCYTKLGSINDLMEEDAKERFKKEVWGELEKGRKGDDGIAVTDVKFTVEWTE